VNTVQTKKAERFDPNRREAKWHPRAASILPRSGGLVAKGWILRGGQRESERGGGGEGGSVCVRAAPLQ
jgi:hypothetical protein